MEPMGSANESSAQLVDAAMMQGMLFMKFNF